MNILLRMTLSTLTLWTLVHAQLRITPVYPLTGITEKWAETREGAQETLALLAPPNGTASAPVVIEAEARQLKDLSFRVSNALSRSGQSGMLAAEHFEVRFATNQNTGQERQRDDFDVLTPENPVDSENIVAVWLTVRVPANQSPGRYQGILEVTSQRVPHQVPFEVEVAEFIMPDPYDMITHVSLYQSPEAVAWHYGVPLWSDAHLDYLEPSFRLMRRVGQKHLNLYVIPDQYFGRTANIPFRTVGGQIQPDFRFAYRYLRRFLDVAGPPESIALIVWTPMWPGIAGRGQLPDTMEVAFVNDQGEFRAGTLPMYGPENTKPLWRGILQGTRQMLDQLGLQNTRLSIGVGSDERPNVDTVRFFKDIAPDMGWYLLTHGRGDPQPTGDIMQIGEMTVSYYISPFGPFRDRGATRPALIGGWDNEFPQISSLRFGLLNPDRPLINYRSAAEGGTEGPWRGITGIGLDFWTVRNPETGRTGSTLIAQGRGWPRMHTGNNRAIAAPGPKGALATTRFEMLLEGIQEAEARITLERVLGNSSLRGQLPGGRAREMETFLKDRVNGRYALLQQNIHGQESIWAPADQAYTQARQLFAYAAEAQKILIRAGQWNQPSPQPSTVPLRNWTDIEGRVIQAQALRRSGDSVVLRLANRQEFLVPLERLSPADITYIQENL